MFASISLAAVCTLLTLTAFAPRALAADPDPHWSADFPNYDLNGSIRSLLEWNGHLVAAGQFLSAGNEYLQFIGAWTGEQWEALPGFAAGLIDSGTWSSDEVLAVLPFEDDLIAVGRFYRGFVEGDPGSRYRMRAARWDGSTWTRLGTDLRGIVRCAAVHGGELYVGGEFTDEGLAHPTSILRWSGDAWQPIDGAPAEGVHVLFDDGDALLAAGRIPAQADPSLFEISAYDGSGWSSVGEPLRRRIVAIARYGGDLHVSASRTFPWESNVAILTRLEGSEWIEVGGGLSGRIADAASATSSVSDLEVIDGRLVVTGDFHAAGGIVANGLAAWDGTAWTSFGQGLSSMGRVVARWADEMAVSGDFDFADDVLVNGLGIWSGDGFRPLRRNQGIQGYVSGFVPTDEGLIVHGNFFSAGHELYPGVARWTGEAFEGLGDNLTGRGTSERSRVNVREVVLHDGNVYAFGDLRVREDSTSTDTVLARFDGTRWHAVETPYDHAFSVVATSWRGQLVFYGEVFAAEDPDSSPVLVAYDGISFTELPFASDDRLIVKLLTVYRDQLIVGGLIHSINGKPFNNIAAWDGTRWDTLKGGVGGTAFAALVVDDELVVGGYFVAVGPYVPARAIARWNGERWSTFGDGFDDDNLEFRQLVASVDVLAVHHGRLHAAGRFDRSGSTPLPGVARWTGSSWEPLSDGPWPYPIALASWNDALFLGGDFDDAGGKNSGAIARWDAPPHAAWANRPRTGIRVDPAVPNPFNPRTSILFSLADRDHVLVEVLDARGRRVAMVFEGVRDAGQHAVEWLGVDEDGKSVGSGVYFVRVSGSSGMDGGGVTLVR